MRKCFNVLKRRVQLNNFVDRLEISLLSKVIYQWQLYCKLRKIRNRYAGEGDIDTTETDSQVMNNEYQQQSSQATIITTNQQEVEEFKGAASGIPVYR